MVVLKLLYRQHLKSQTRAGGVVLRSSGSGAFVLCGTKETAPTPAVHPNPK